MDVQHNTLQDGDSHPIGYILPTAQLPLPNTVLPGICGFDPTTGQAVISNGLDRWLSLGAPSLGRTVFVDGTSGDDTNSGTPEAPLKTIQAGLDTPLVTKVVVRPGVYRITDPLEVKTNCELITTLGPSTGYWTNPDTTGEVDTTNLLVDVRCSVAMPDGWTAHTGGTATYRHSVVSLGQVFGVFDAQTADAHGQWTRYTRVAATNLDTLNAGEWTVSGAYLYVRCLGDVNPATLKLEATTSICADGLYLLDGVQAFRAQGLTITGAYNVGWRFDQRITGSGLTADRNCQLSWVQLDNCGARYCYGISTTLTTWYGRGFRAFGPFAMHLNGCLVYGSGIDGIDYLYGAIGTCTHCVSCRNVDNGLSPHNRSVVTVIGGQYTDNGDQNLVAVSGSLLRVQGALVRSSGTVGVQATDPGTCIQLAGCYIGGNPVGVKASGNAIIQMTGWPYPSAGDPDANAANEDVLTGGTIYHHDTVPA